MRRSATARHVVEAVFASPIAAVAGDLAANKTSRRWRSHGFDGDNSRGHGYSNPANHPLDGIDLLPSLSDGRQLSNGGCSGEGSVRRNSGLCAQDAGSCSRTASISICSMWPETRVNATI